MNFREAVPADIPQIQVVRNSVKENSLSDPALVSDKDCEEYMTIRGKAWVCEIKSVVIGFAYVDMKENNIWALFIHPEFEKKGIGKTLQQIMMNWYFSITDKNVWLSTAVGTRAEIFYRKQGWQENGMHGKEIKFEMSRKNWMQRINSSDSFT